ncbi:hypothetical protein TNCV_2003701 [Trichonephila clavipes]|nr:hypothetical protein TNCV_2003701 [Trichonephila clavipes]
MLWRNSPWRSMPIVPISVFMIFGTGVHEQMFLSGGQSDAKSPVFSSQASLVLIYRSNEEMKGGVNLAQPRILTTDLWRRSEAIRDQITTRTAFPFRHAMHVPRA